MRKKLIITSFLFVLLTLIVLIWYRQEMRYYFIECNRDAVEVAVEDHLNSDIDIHKIFDLDNKKLPPRYGSSMHERDKKSGERHK
ncbi:hypothetical protein ACH6EH_18110 [Paenibacillus sp. JSM ZJ436]|uniref:hypothetical protein n=1 Tax=Paenibacillus sp. JSM ZJ436 TaxID=3376190 RepID=UPI00378A2C7D